MAGAERRPRWVRFPCATATQNLNASRVLPHGTAPAGPAPRSISCRPIPPCAAVFRHMSGTWNIALLAGLHAGTDPTAWTLRERHRRRSSTSSRTSSASDFASSAADDDASSAVRPTAFNRLKWRLRSQAGAESLAYDTSENAEDRQREDGPSLPRHRTGGHRFGEPICPPYGFCQTSVVATTGPARASLVVRQTLPVL